MNTRMYTLAAKVFVERIGGEPPNFVFCLLDFTVSSIHNAIYLLTMPFVVCGVKVVSHAKNFTLNM